MIVAILYTELENPGVKSASLQPRHGLLIPMPAA